MSHSSLISIIIPVYNAEQYLETCLNSILKQSYKKYEVLLINDGSSDKSEEIANRFVKSDKRFTLFNKKNEGPSATRNYGIANSSGQYFLFIDADDFLEPEYIENMVQLISNHDLGICGYVSIYSDNRKVDRAPDKGSISQEKLLSRFGVLYEDQIIQYLWNKIYLAEIVIKNNLKFDESIKRGEDILFNLKYLNLVRHINLTDKILYNYIRTNQNSLTTKHNVSLFDEQKMIFMNIRDFLESHNKYECNLETVERIFMSRILECISNLFRAGAPTNKVIIKEKIYEIIDDVTVRDKINFMSTKNIKLKILKILIQMRLTDGIYRVYKKNN